MIFFCGIVWSQLVLREISLFDRKGKKAAIVLQKGFGLTTEKYEIYFARSKEVLVAVRRRFALRRGFALKPLCPFLYPNAAIKDGTERLIKEICADRGKSVGKMTHGDPPENKHNISFIGVDKVRNTQIFADFFRTNILN